MRYLSKITKIIEVEQSLNPNMMKPDLEVCVFSVESCLNAQRASAHRVELCGGFLEGGTTPSAGLIEHVRSLLHIDLHVMIRPRGGDFLYDDWEFETMKKDIETAQKYGANGVVFGILTQNGKVDLPRTRGLVSLARPMQVTFHRAFDMTPDPLEALEMVIKTGAHAILTSGQRQTAIEGVETIAQLVAAAAGRIKIMAGAGITAQNALQIAATGVDSLHLTGKTTRASQMQFRQANVQMATAAPASEYEVVFSDAAKIAAIRQLFLPTDDAPF